MKINITNAYNNYTLKDFCIILFSYLTPEQRLDFSAKLLTVKYPISKHFEVSENIHQDIQEQRALMPSFTKSKCISLDDFNLLLNACYACYGINPSRSVRHVVDEFVTENELLY
jgi:hypothetical protein